MSKKLDQTRNVLTGSSVSKPLKVISDALTPLNEGKPSDSTHQFSELPLNEITPRSINKYGQRRIERLAESIKNTNNSLIHPIVVVKAEYLPEDSKVIQEYIKQGVDVKKLKYIIVAGERRFRAWTLLRNEAEKNKLSPFESNPFDTITARVLSFTDAKSEEAFYDDSNLEARQLTPLEGILHIQTALTEVDTDEKKRDALIEMNGGNEDNIPKDASKAAKKFNTAKYCHYFLENELGIEGWSSGTVKRYLQIINNCCDEILDAILDGKFSANKAKVLTTLPKEKQIELLNSYIEKGEAEFNKLLKEIKDDKEASEKTTHKKKVYTRAKVKKELTTSLEKVKKEEEKMIEMLENMESESTKLVVKKTLKKIEALIDELNGSIHDLR